MGFVVSLAESWCGSGCVHDPITTLSADPPKLWSGPLPARTVTATTTTANCCTVQVWMDAAVGSLPLSLSPSPLPFALSSPTAHRRQTEVIGVWGSRPSRARDGVGQVRILVDVLGPVVTLTAFVFRLGLGLGLGFDCLGGGDETQESISKMGGCGVHIRTPKMLGGNPAFTARG
ncbi:hypothetical protein IE53DRAFT_98813 [Violaceomyces palustris]|uniref:Uncharacterized protein n=1 Tax=Violaceomyces palustris TaxID=1673888 RepID=A0ACD0NWZ2_9BASI|nr:hypothetical protein IE53DRAFT_98813 [Violaceomyces palustris]